MLSGSATVPRAGQLAKAYHPMFVTVSGMVTLVRLEQLSNVYERRLVTLRGMVTLCRRVHPPKAPEAMKFTLEGIVMVGRLVHPKNVSRPMALTPLARYTFVRLKQFPKAPSAYGPPSSGPRYPMAATRAGMIIPGRLTQL